MILALLPLLSLQQVGGSWERFETWESSSTPSSIALLGDVDDDGHDDFLAGYAIPNGYGYVAVLSGLDGSEIYAIHRPDRSYGLTLAALGDLDHDGAPDFAVAAPFADANGFVRNGYVEVYSGATGSTIYLRTGPAMDCKFGEVLSAIGPSPSALLISAAGLNPNGSGTRGAAYLYEGRTGLLRLTVDGPANVSTFGWNTADAGSYGGPGTQAFAIGVPSVEVAGRPNNGVVVVHSATTGAVLDTISIPSQLFGYKVTRVPDFDGDARDDLAVTEGGIGTWFAQVHLFSAANGYHRNLSGLQNTSFGSSMLSADFDHDGTPELAVGSWDYRSAGFVRGGAVYLYRIPSGELVTVLEGTATDQRLGSSLHLGIQDRFGGLGPDLIAGGSFSTRFAEGFAFNDHLFSIGDVVTVQFGGRVRFTLDFPDSEAGKNYLMLASLAGAGPTNFGGILVPLTRDALYNRMILNPPSVLRRARGTLDVEGSASAVLDVAPGAVAAWVGRTMSFAAVTVEGWRARVSSTRVTVRIVN